jgi:NitT/TauT family transport system ATP-binding protein
MFQEAALFPWLSVAGNVELPMRLKGVGKAERKRRAEELLDIVRLRGFGDKRPHELSGGMRQRVALARSLAQDADILLMDEPFGALDEMTRERMQDELVDLSAQTGCAVIFVTHSIPEAVYLSNRVVVMSPRPGRVSAILPIALGERTEDTREDATFFAAVTAVREALRAPDRLGVEPR